MASHQGTGLRGAGGFPDPDQLNNLFSGLLSTCVRINAERRIHIMLTVTLTKEEQAKKAKIAKRHVNYGNGNRRYSVTALS